MDDAPLLLPRPHSCRRIGGRCTVPTPLTIDGIPREMAGRILGEDVRPAAPAWLTAVEEKGHPAEGYRLAVTSEGAVIRASGPPGLRWGLTTLAQLLRQYGRSLPALDIEDEPIHAHRGIMLDISRDRVPTLQTLRTLIDHLASWKINHLQLYTEHTFAYPGHETVWRSASPITPEEARALDRYAADRGIDMAANQNCFGHFERWLRHPAYAPLGECDRPRMEAGAHYREPNTLCPTDPAALELVEELLSAITPCYSSPRVNIGCDEPWDLGHGRSADACRRRGRKAVFSEYVSRVAGLVLDAGRIPQFWVDPHPNEGSSLPRDLTALVWGYHEDFDFLPNASAHREAGRAVWVCPGSGAFLSFTGRTTVRRTNLAHAADAAPLAEGLLMTCWGDRGHRQQWPVDLAALADGAQAAWSGPVFEDRALGLHAFGCADLGGWMADLGDVDRDISTGRCGGEPSPGNALFAEMHANLFDPAGRERGTEADWAAVASRIEALERRLPEGIDPLLEREARHAVDCARVAARRARERRRPGGPSGEGRTRIAADLCRIIGEHRAMWLERSRPGGLNDSTAQYSRLARYG